MALLIFQYKTGTESPLTASEVTPAFTVFTGTDVVDANFGASTFAYSVPAGHSTNSAGVWDTGYTTYGADISLSNGNLRAVGTSGGGLATWYANFSLITGKWYWETTVSTSTAGATMAVGIKEYYNTATSYTTRLGADDDHSFGIWAQSGDIYQGVPPSSFLLLFDGPLIGVTPTVIRHKYDADIRQYSIAVESGSFHDYTVP